MTRPWKPTFLESRCLQQLDVAENWRLLKREQPPIDEVLTWAPFVRIFWFNCAVFGLLFAAIGAGFAVALDSSNLTVIALGGAGGIVAGAIMALGATNIYRNAWNRRARTYLEE